MSDKEEKKEIRVSLEMYLHEMIEEIKQYYGLISVSETLRLIIKLFYDSQFKKLKKDTESE